MQKLKDKLRVSSRIFTLNALSFAARTVLISAVSIIAMQYEGKTNNQWSV